LNAYNVYCGTPGHFEADLQRYLDVTADDLAAAARHLAGGAEAAVSVVPRGQADRALRHSVPA
jgi:hypothetical protein